MYLLISNGHNDLIKSDNLTILVTNAGVTFDYDRREIYIKGKLDTVSYSREYGPREFLKVATERALNVLVRDYGYSLYELIKGE